MTDGNKLTVPDITPDPEKADETAGVTLRGLIRALISLKFSLFIIVLIAVSCAVGTLLPQGPREVMMYVQKNPDSLHAMERLTALGLTNVFAAKWFVALLCILCAELLVCSYRRLSFLKTASGAAKARIYGTLLTHASIILILAGVVIRGGWSISGYMEMREGDAFNQIAVDGRPVDIPFTVRLLDFEVERYQLEGQETGSEQDAILEYLTVSWPEEERELRFPVMPGSVNEVAPKSGSGGKGTSYNLKILRRVTDFSVDMTTKEISSRSTNMSNPAILVNVSGGNISYDKWLFARYPDFDMHSRSDSVSNLPPFKLNYEVFLQPAAKGPIKAFNSRVQVIEDNKVVKEQVIRVNEPFYYGGYTFYQSGFHEDDLSWTSLQVVKDPSVPVVYLGFLLLTVGLMVVTYSRTVSAEEKPSAKGE